MLKRLMTWLMGKRLALRLGFYDPPGISPNNLIVHSYIYGIDDLRQEAPIEIHYDADGDGSFE